MKDWKIYESGVHPEKAAKLGNRFLIGNGLIGIRGTLEEYEKDMLPAINLAGVYDENGGWREPINLPNGCYSYLRVDGECYGIPEAEPIAHKMELDYRHGIFSRETLYQTPRGNVSLSYERFASMEDPFLYGMKWRIQADFHADIELVTGFDCDVWDLNGPHLEDIHMEDTDEILHVDARTHEEGVFLQEEEMIHGEFPMEYKVIQTENKILRRIFFVTMPDTDYVIEKLVAIDVGKSFREHQEKVELRSRLLDAMEIGYEKKKEAHMNAWENLWKTCEVEVGGDEEAMEALNYSLYHLNSIAPRHAEGLSIPARGLSGQTYKGAVFWDTEMFMLDFYLLTDPKTARSLMKYRIDTLPGALQKAKAYGYEGAFYAWESQEGGFDACSDYNVTDVFTGRPLRTFFKDKQVHISSAVVYGILGYVSWTGDESILEQGGIRTILECARFYYSLLTKRINRDQYDILDVIGPDEYHERVNNNFYTNRMAKFVFEETVKLLRKYGDSQWMPEEFKAHELEEIYQDAISHLYIPAPGEDPKRPEIIPQFDGYFDLEDVSVDTVRGRLLQEKEYWGGAYGVASHTQVIKQADVVTGLNLFSEDYHRDILASNFKYYEPRTEHGSSLSAGMYSMLACKIDEPDWAYPFFLQSARADLNEGGKEWAGLIYIGGTHPAAAGAAYMTAVFGFAGLSVEDGRLVCHPHLPEKMKSLKFTVKYLGKTYGISIFEDNYSIVETSIP